MNLCRWDAPLRGFTCTCVTAFCLITAMSNLQAAESEFGYSASVSETYNGDVFRFGISQEPQTDFITAFSVPMSVAWRTPRSRSSVNYSPDYIKYATFTELDSLNHRLSGAWNMTPGHHSAVGVRVGYANTNQQAGFQSFSSVGGNPSDPILQLTRRITWDVSPYHRIDIGRRWSMQTRALYRSMQFSDPTLSDGATAALILSADARMRGHRRLGGVVRYGWNFFSKNSLTTMTRKPQDRVLNIEATWSQQEGTVFRWATALGFFRVIGDNRPITGAPTLRSSATWKLVRSAIQAGYGLGFSTVAGSVGTSRSETAYFVFSRSSGVGFTWSAAADYIRFKSLGNATFVRYLDGYSLTVRAAYKWPTRWGLVFDARHLEQEQTNGRSLNYILATIGVTFTPDRPISRGGTP